MCTAKELAIKRDLSAIELVVRLVRELVFNHLELAARVGVECVETTADDGAVGV